MSGCTPCSTYQGPKYASHQSLHLHSGQRLHFVYTSACSRARVAVSIKTTSHGVASTTPATTTASATLTCDSIGSMVGFVRTTIATLLTAPFMLGACGVMLQCIGGCTCLEARERSASISSATLMSKSRLCKVTDEQVKVIHDTQMLMTNENSRTLLVRPSKSQPGSVVMSMGQQR